MTTAAAEGAPVVDWVDPAELHVDPYPALARLRAEAPVAFVPRMGVHLAVSYSAVRQILADPGTFGSTGSNRSARVFGTSPMVNTDGDAHDRVRRPVNPTMRPRAMKERWVRMFTENTRHYLDELAAAGPDHADLNDVFAAPLATRNLIDLLSLRDVEVERVREWSLALIAGIGNVTEDQRIWARWEAARADMDTHLADTIGFLRRRPDDSFTSALVAAGLPDDIVAANVRLAISGGMNEPQHALTTAVWALGRHPEQRARALSGERWTDVFEEAVRWVSPLGSVVRHVHGDTAVVDGVPLPHGATVLASTRSANRDAGVFADADVFDFRRERHPHFAFSGGPHICAGMWAARWEVGEVALPMLFRRFEGLRNAEDRPARWWGFIFRGLTQHPVTWDRDRGND